MTSIELDEFVQRSVDVADKMEKLVRQQVESVPPRWRERIRSLSCQVVRDFDDDEGYLALRRALAAESAGTVKRNRLAPKGRAKDVLKFVLHLRRLVIELRVESARFLFSSIDKT